VVMGLLGYCDVDVFVIDSWRAVNFTTWTKSVVGQLR
jgi:hypothetical protein